MTKTKEKKKMQGSKSKNKDKKAENREFRPMSEAESNKLKEKAAKRLEKTGKASLPLGVVLR